MTGCSPSGCFPTVWIETWLEGDRVGCFFAYTVFFYTEEIEKIDSLW